MRLQQTFQSQIIGDDLRKFHHRLPRIKKIGLRQSIKDKAKNYFKVFLETSSIHGLNHFVAIRRHPVEVILWIIIVALSVFGTVSLSQTTWVRYQSSPTVISMDRDMFAWNTTFPSVTICPEKKLDEKKLGLYIKNSKEPDKKKLETFIRAISNATYNNFDKIPIYDGIPPEKYIELLVNLSLPFKPTLTVGMIGVILKIIPTVTEMGLCYAMNSEVAVYNSPGYRDTNRWDTIPTENKTLYVHPLDGEVFAQAVNLSTAYKVYIHGPHEFPDISTKHEHSTEDFYMKLYVTSVAIYTTIEAAKLSITQRRCRFPHENNLKHNSIYTYTMCRMECRIRMCLKYCQCIPHFYRAIGKEKICDVKGLQCLSKYQDLFYRLRDKADKKIQCDCFPLCDDVNYVVQLNVLQEWFLGTNLQWGMTTYPRMRYRRDIIFGFTDVLVAVGGMAGLFLGCSVLSFMEIIYFITIRLLCYTRTEYNNINKGNR